MFALAIKEIRFFKLKYSLIGFILFLLASLVFIVSGLAGGLSLNNVAMLENSHANHFFLSEDAENRLDQSGYIVDDLLEALPREGGWEPFLIQNYRLDADSSETKLAVTMMPVDPNSFLYPGVIEGTDLSDSEAIEIVVDQSMKVDGVTIGDTLYEEDNDLSFEVIGFTEGQTYRHAPVAYLAETAFYSLELTPHTVANAIVIETEETVLQAAITGAFDEGVWVGKADVIDGVPGHSSEQMSLNMMIFFLIVIAVFVLAAFFYILTIQKLNQFGVLKALGASNQFLIGATLLQVLTLTTVSLILAIGFTYFITTILPEGMPFDFNSGLLVQYSVTMLAVSLIGALLSAIKIVKIDPQQAIGRVE
ncbi:putative ABC transport system permease protein [Amphibacillus marinus]|uniref:Putative hemin transport system permease protein HrtB n=1 Tax=Amphibacillus marinus TaxID=872970 RepID=A0A1H8QDM6_9BACI|nr:FtsX-like permease family protein [Amphibacillus marinus]SEO52156.1 putative ABC transport system permease protein [Amphibacillus marinus]